MRCARETSLSSNSPISITLKDRVACVRATAGRMSPNVDNLSNCAPQVRTKILRYSDEVAMYESVCQDPIRLTACSRSALLLAAVLSQASTSQRDDDSRALPSPNTKRQCIRDGTRSRTAFMCPRTEDLTALIAQTKDKETGVFDSAQSTSAVGE